MMSILNIEGYKNMLLEKQNSLNNLVNKINEHHLNTNQMYGHSELSNYDNHPGDLGTDVFQVEMNHALKSHEQKIMKDVQEALERIENGTYGKCANCLHDIDEERLEALPYAKLCMECEDGREKEEHSSTDRRPIEETVLENPYGQRIINENTEEDHRLEYIDDLMKFGSSDTPQDMGGYDDYENFYKTDADS